MTLIENNPLGLGVVDFCGEFLRLGKIGLSQSRESLKNSAIF